MGLIREAIESRIPLDAACFPRFGRLPSDSEVEAAEAALGLSLPAPLRDLYREFDGLWLGPPGAGPCPPGGDDPYFPLPREFVSPAHAPFQDDDGSDPYLVLPLGYLPAARDLLVELYGRAARDRLVARFGPREEEGYNDFEGQLRRSVAFSLVEAGASFQFLTDRGAWELGAGRVGSWGHDSAQGADLGPLVGFLAESIGWMTQLR